MIALVQLLLQAAKHIQEVTKHVRLADSGEFSSLAEKVQDYNAETMRDLF